MLINFFKNIFSKKKVVKNYYDRYDNPFIKIANELERKVYDLDFQLGEFISEEEKEKANLLKKIGLINTQDVKELEEQSKKIENIQKIRDIFTYFKTFYPQHSIVLYKQIELFSLENGFVFSDLKYYNGEIPDENYYELNHFNFRVEDNFYYGIPNYNVLSFGIESAQHIYKKGFEISNKETYDSFIHNSQSQMFLYNKKIYYDNFPLLVCTQFKNLNEPENLMQSIETNSINPTPPVKPTPPKSQHDIYYNIQSDSYYKGVKRNFLYKDQIVNNPNSNEKNKESLIITHGKKEIQQKKYNEDLGFTVILKPFFRFDIYGFIIVTIIKDKQSS